MLRVAATSARARRTTETAQAPLSATGGANRRMSTMFYREANLTLAD